MIPPRPAWPTAAQGLADPSAAPTSVLDFGAFHAVRSSCSISQSDSGRTVGAVYMMPRSTDKRSKTWTRARLFTSPPPPKPSHAILARLTGSVVTYASLRSNHALYRKKGSTNESDAGNDTHFAHSGRQSSGRGSSSGERYARICHRRTRYRRGHRRYWPDVLRRTADRCPEGCRGCPGSIGHRRKPPARRSHFREAAPCGQWFGSRGPVHAGAVTYRYCLVGHQGQSPQSIGLLTARRLSRSCSHLCQRRAHASVSGRLSSESRTSPGGHGLQADENAAWRRADGGARGRAHQGTARGHWRRHRSDVRHQPALERQPGDRHWPPRRAVSPLLARGCGGP